MMPILPENRNRYPKDWPQISRRIRFERAQGRCECEGECGLDHGGRCKAVNGEPHPVTLSRVVLTVAHLPGREVEQCGDDDLKAMCQRCHLIMDKDIHRRNRANTVRRRKASGDLFDV
jgi:hypothetical protein